MKRLALMTAMTGVLAWQAPAWADITIQGTVKFFDQAANTYRPARNVDVTVDGSWFGGDPCVVTDDNGFYKTQVGDPWLGLGGFNIFVNAATRVGGCGGPARFQVKRALLSPTTYIAASAMSLNVGAGQTATIDLNIAGPSNNEQANCTIPCYATSKEIANAFLVTEEIESHWRKLREGGFVQDSLMQGLNVIVPAWSMSTSFTNLLMNAINLVAYANNSATAGLDNWDNLDTGTDGSYDGYSYFLGGVRHELSHYIQGHLTSPNFPPGLLTAAVHCFAEQSSQNLAYTEGFAEFLPMVTIPVMNGGDYGPTGGIDFTKKCNGDPGNNVSDHAAVEGEVAGLLWHLFSPLAPGTTDRVRRPATTADDGTSLMESKHLAIRVAQVWEDRIDDPALAKIKTALQTGPANTVHDFLGAFLAANPDVHALKTIAANREIDLADHPENPAGVDGEVRVTWTEVGDASATKGKVRLDFKVKEPDAEDRELVRLTVFHRRKGNLTTAMKIAEQELNSGWNGDTREVSWTVELRKPQGTTTPDLCTEDELWILVNDEMLPRVAHLCVPGLPAAADTTTSGGPTWRWAGLPYQKVPDKRLKQLPKKPLDPRPPRPWANSQDVADLRGLVSQAQAVLQEYDARRRLAQGTDHALYQLGHDLGQLKVQGAGPALQYSEPVWARSKGKRPGGMATRQAAPAGLVEYNQWLSQAAAGKTSPVANLSAAARKGLAAHRDMLTAAWAAQQAAPARAEQLSLKLAKAWQVLMPPEGPLADQMRELRQALVASASDSAELSVILQTRHQALQALLGGK